MSNRSSRTAIATVIATTVALGTALAFTAPASAADLDPTPVQYITGSHTGFTAIYGVAMSSNGTVYEIEYNAKAIEIFAPGATGNVAPVRTIKGSNTQIDEPYDVAIDADGHIWLVDDSNEIVEFAANASGNATPINVIEGADTGLDDPTGIAFGSDGTIYVMNYGNVGLPSIEAFAANATGDATPVRTISGSNTQLAHPYGVAVAPDGTLVATSESPGSVQTFAGNGNGNIAPLTDIIGADTGLDAPYYSAVDPEGNIWTANYSGSTITEYAPGANDDATPINRIVGATSHTSGPYPMRIDAAGRMIVGNYDGKSVAVFDTSFAINGVTPNAGTTNGGTKITIHGNGFAAGAVVTLGGATLTDVRVVSSTEITATVPAHAAGPATLTVSQDGVTVTLASAFTYRVVLAETGVDPTTGLLWATILLLAGLAATGIRTATRRRAKLS